MTRPARSFLILLISILTATFVISPSALAADDAEGELSDEELFYIMGAAIADSLRNAYRPSEKERESLEKGIKDGLAGKAKQDPQKHQAQLTALTKERQELVAKEEAAESKKFLDDAGAAKGAKVTESGLIITQVTTGSGESPKPTDKVKVHYTGTLRNGDVFDSSVERGEPVTFPLNRVIPCWTEGVGMMKPGGKAQLICPSDIAYGDQGRPPQIPGGAALIFDVELIEVVSGP